MKILGINFSNDSAAALVEDGVVTAACQEERFSRVKHDASFPRRAVELCLERGGVGLESVDAVAFFWNPGIHAMAPTRRLSSVPRHQLEFLHAVPTNLLGMMNGARVEGLDQVIRLASGMELKIHYVTHHMCHAAAAFYTSPFEEAAILTADGYGERQATGIFSGNGVEIDELLSVDFPHSLGAVYAAFTQYLGFRPNSGEGKVMGLASYGAASDLAGKVREMIRPTDEGFEVDLSCFEYFHDRPRRYSEKLVDLLGPPRAPESGIERRHMDIAWALQAATEETLLHLARLARDRTGAGNLCLAGGVGLNCVANGRLAREAGFDECFFYPAAGDAGTSVGAALFAYHRIHGGGRSMAVADEYLGAEYDDGEILDALRRTDARHAKISDPMEAAARMIADGLVIGWFQGRAEFGPRALGNRSILADPGRADMKDLLNSRVKFREEFRPYAPSVIEEACGDFFSSAAPSPYMLRAYETLEDKREVLPAITHVDGTARVQTVSRDANPRYHDLIRRVGELTGAPVVLNTSFNIRGEPIVNTPEEAIRCLFGTGMDALFLGDFLVIKDPEKVAPYLP